MTQAIIEKKINKAASEMSDLIKKSKRKLLELEALSSTEIKKRKDMIVIPRKEYQELLALRKIREVKMTPAQRAALRRAEKNLKQGKTLSFDEFRRKLAPAH